MKIKLLKTSTALCSMSATALLYTSAALANPHGGVVAAGGATITENGKKLDIHQHTNRAVIDWRGFDIAVDEHTQFHQPSASATALNRVNSSDPSRIAGKLSANGNIILVNPNGVFFEGTSKVDVNGLIATTANIDNDDFMTDNLRFSQPGNPDAAIINEGSITAKEAGLVGLVAARVENHGVINARMGRVELASGDTFAVDLYGDGLFNLAVSDDVTEQLVHHTGHITAEGGTIALSAAAGREIVDSLIQVEGELRAPAAVKKGGKIIIGAAGSNAVAGNKAEDKGKKDGQSTVVIADALIDVSGTDAGEQGGALEVTADTIGIMTGTVIHASGYSAPSDDDSDGSASLTADKQVRKEEEFLAHGDRAGGSIKIGGDYLGTGNTPTATYVYVDPYSLILNDALNYGDGGRTIIWSDDTTDYYGNVYARGGENGGHGGFLETSGKINLVAQGYADLTAEDGYNKGTYLLDPANITIYGNFDPRFNNGSINLDTDIQLWLDATDLSALSDGDNVASWTDKSGKVGRDATAIGGREPQYFSAQVGGNGVVRFTENNSDELSGSLGGGSITELTVLLMGNFEQLNQPAGDYDYLYSIGNVATDVVSISRTASNWAGGPDRYYSYTEGQVRVGPTLDNTHQIFTQQFGAAAPYHGLFLNGEAQTVDAHNAQIDVNGSYTLGRWIGGSLHYLEGDIGEVVIYDKALSAEAVNLLNQYQSAKWGVALTPPGTGATEVAQATAADGYSEFTTRYLERLSQSADISLIATNNITLDLQGDTFDITTANRSFSMNAGNQITTASAGTIQTNGGDINLTATNGIAINHALTFNSQGGDVTFDDNITLAANQIVNAGAGAVQFKGMVDGGFDLTVNGNDITTNHAIGRETSLNDVSLTAANSATIKMIDAASISVTATAGDISGSGGLMTNGGNIKLNAGNDLDLRSFGIQSSNGNLDFDAGNDAHLSTWIDAGTGTLDVDAGNDITLTAIDVATNLIGRWNLDEGSGVTISDSAGSNNGTLHGDATFSTTTPFDSGRSLTFDGAGDYADIGDLGITGDWTASLWVYLASSGPVIQYPLGYANNDGIYVEYGALGDVWGSYDGSNLLNGQNLDESSWQHLTVTKSGLNYSIYLNGTLENTLARNDVDLSNIQIGRRGDGAFNYNGLVDDLRIYDAALTASDVAKLNAPQVAWQTGTISFTAGNDISLAGDVNAGANALNLTATAGSISRTSGTLTADSINFDAGGTIVADVAATTAIDLAGNATGATLTGKLGGLATQTEADLITGGPGDDPLYTFEGFTIRKAVVAAGGGGGGAPAPVVPVTPEPEEVEIPTEPETPLVEDEPIVPETPMVENTGNEEVEVVTDAPGVIEIPNTVEVVSQSPAMVGNASSAVDSRVIGDPVNVASDAPSSAETATNAPVSESSDDAINDSAYTVKDSKEHKTIFDGMVVIHPDLVRILDIDEDDGLF